MEEKRKKFLQKIVDESIDFYTPSSMIDLKNLAKEVLQGRYAYNTDTTIFKIISSGLYYESQPNFSNKKILEMLRNGKIQELIDEFERTMRCAELAEEATALLNSL